MPEPVNPQTQRLRDEAEQWARTLERSSPGWLTARDHVPQLLMTLVAALETAERERGEARQEIIDATAWFADHFQDEDGEPADLNLTQMLERVLQWGDGAWGTAGMELDRRVKAEAELDEARKALAVTVEAMELRDLDGCCRWCGYSRVGGHAQGCRFSEAIAIARAAAGVSAGSEGAGVRP